jgi:hypothetical protein
MIVILFLGQHEIVPAKLLVDSDSSGVASLFPAHDEIDPATSLVEIVLEGWLPIHEICVLLVEKCLLLEAVRTSF